MKKHAIIISLSIASFIFSLFFSSILSAQFLPAVDPKDLNKERALTQKDVNFVVKYCQLLKKFHVDQIEGSADEILDFLENSGLTPERQVYDIRKVLTLSLIVAGELSPKDLDTRKEPFLKYNSNEENLIKENIDALAKAINEAYPPETP